MKKVKRIHRSAGTHWVGDGFPVRTMFSYHERAQEISPFLLLDYAGPAEFAPSEKPRGVEQHPHRGFETVTIAYHGEVEHKDNAGNSGTIRPGDVQWMTAGKGILHEEMHSRSFTASGGIFEVIQLWVNLPARDKMTAPKYQELTSASIPTVSLDRGSVRVISGEFNGHTGPAQTFTPVHLWDIRLESGGEHHFDLNDGYTTMIMIRRGRITINADESASAGELVVFDRAGKDALIHADEDAEFLILSGEPIDESVVGHGPFVMNTMDEIRQAFVDFTRGEFNGTSDNPAPV